MADSRIQELFKQEQNIWLRKLEALQLEIVSMKNHIAEIVQREVKPEMLETLEGFQTNFLDKDMILALLRRDITQLSALIQFRGGMESDNAIRLTYQRQEALRKDITKMEIELEKIKSEFKKLQIM